MPRCFIRWVWAVAFPAGCAGSPTEALTVSASASSTETSASSDGDSMTTTGAAATSSSDSGSTTGASTFADTSTQTTTDEAGTTQWSTSSASTSSEEESSTTQPRDACHIVLNEVFSDAEGADDLLEWIEIYNPCEEAFDLSDASLAWGGSTYADALDLVGSIAPGGCFVVGGPTTDVINGSPSFDQPIDFDADLQNTTSDAADGIALFDVPAAEIAMAVPLDALIYGVENVNELIDESGEPGVVDVATGMAGEVYARVDPAVAPGGEQWVVAPVPTPGVCPNPPA